MALVWRADALLGGVAVVATRARIHACHEHEAGGIFGAILCSRNSDYAVFQRLAHDFEHIAVELWQLIEKEHPVVGQANFARHGITAASHERHGTSIRLCGGAKLALLSYYHVFNVPTACRHFSSEI